MEPITIGQKIAFACIISVVVFLCVAPLIFHQQSQSKGQENANETGRDQVEHVIQVR